MSRRDEACPRMFAAKKDSRVRLKAVKLIAEDSKSVESLTSTDIHYTDLESEKQSCWSD